jgi:4-amino-4-deoxy-L-arabinose transferase-like glycosyltransferase
MKSIVIHFAGVVLISLILLGVGVERASVGTVYSDPVAKIRAQDESMYANMALRQASTGDWLTPKVMGRYLLQKPPLLTWLAGLSLKFFGTSLFALRLPALAAAIFCTVVVFALARGSGSPMPGWAAVLLLLSNSLWHIFARLCYTDMLLVGCITGSVATFLYDPLLERRRSLWGFAAFCATAVMAKNTAGLLPFVIVAVYWILADRSRRPSPARITLALALSVALVAPWHIYQIVAHRQWFWSDYVQTQLLVFGLHPPAQSSTESQLAFYSKRLILTDPVLFVLLIVAIPFLIRDVRRRAATMPAVILAWLAVTVGALLLFRYRNLPYALYLIPPACLAAAVYGPVFSRRSSKISLAALVLVFALKCFSPGQPWGITFGAAEPLPAVAALHSYYELARPNELILVDSDDDLYAAALPLPRVRYCFLDPDNVVSKYAPHYATLGITLTEEEFENLDYLEPAYEARLKEWGLDSPEPIGTAIVITSRAMLPRLFRAYRNSDFYVSDADWELLQHATPVDQTHQTITASNGRKFLLARYPSQRMTAHLTQVPAGW